jgi:hypothetical protein
MNAPSIIFLSSSAKSSHLVSAFRFQNPQNISQKTAKKTTKVLDAFCRLVLKLLPYTSEEAGCPPETATPCMAHSPTIA